MIRRKPSRASALSSAKEIVSANVFDDDSPAYVAKIETVARNLSLSAAPTKEQSAKEKAGKKRPKQTKTPSQVKAEKEKKEAGKKKVKKVTPGEKSPAAIKGKTGGSGTNKAKPHPNHGGGGGSSTKRGGADVADKPITARWSKMTHSARSSYIQSKAGPGIKTADADEALSKLWSKLTLRQQQAHLRRHPDTRLKVTEAGGARREEAIKRGKMFKTPEEMAVNEDQGRGPGPKDEKPASWWNGLSTRDQQEYLEKYPDSKFAVRHRGIVRNLVRKAGEKIHAEAKKIGNDYHQGMDGIRAFREGDKMTPEQEEGLKTTSIRIGSILVLALIGVALFSPLGPAAMEFGETWFNERASGSNKAANYSSESGVNVKGHERTAPTSPADVAKDAHALQWMTTDMTEYLLKQDPAKLAAKISKADKLHRHEPEHQ